MVLLSGATGRSHEQFDIYYLMTPLGSLFCFHALEHDIQSEVGH